MPKVKSKRKSGSEEVSVVKKSRTVERRYGFKYTFHERPSKCLPAHPSSKAVIVNGCTSRDGRNSSEDAKNVEQQRMKCFNQYAGDITTQPTTYIYTVMARWGRNWTRRSGEVLL